MFSFLSSCGMWEISWLSEFLSLKFFIIFCLFIFLFSSIITLPMAPTFLLQPFEWIYCIIYLFKYLPLFLFQRASFHFARTWIRSFYIHLKHQLLYNWEKLITPSLSHHDTFYKILLDTLIEASIYFQDKDFVVKRNFPHCLTLCFMHKKWRINVCWTELLQ